ncbi:MAG TPA: hypothetical protein DCE55_10130 [Planctomycetaceae bacterium]|nr:hypothetical protein [Planctomycetaceae bacterium]
MRCPWQRTELIGAGPGGDPSNRLRLVGFRSGFVRPGARREIAVDLCSRAAACSDRPLELLADETDGSPASWTVRPAVCKFF